MLRMLCPSLECVIITGWASEHSPILDFTVSNTSLSSVDASTRKNNNNNNKK